MRVYIKYESGEFAYPEDMKKILAYLREHGVLQVSEAKVEDLYREFSGSRCAGWLMVDDEMLKEFADWLNDYDDEEDCP